VVKFNARRRRVISVSTCFVVIAVLSVDVQAAIRNRYSFNNSPGATVHGMSVIEDLVGPHDGIVKGGNGFFTGSQLVFPGGTHADGGAYVDLPNGMISSIETDATFEAWYTLNSTADDWVRIWDFGDNRAMDGVWVEIHEPGAITGFAGDTFFYTPMRGTNPNLQRVTLENDGPFSSHVPPIPGNVNFSNVPLDTSVSQTIGQEQHVVVTLVRDADGMGPELIPQLSIYLNGGLAGTYIPTAEAAHQLVNLHDVNNWLGRSNYAADSVLNGSINEFRIYDHAFTGEQVADSFLRGPNTVPEPTALLLLICAVIGTSLLARRKTGAIRAACCCHE
jgi:hypothetical protein